MKLFIFVSDISLAEIDLEFTINQLILGIILTHGITILPSIATIMLVRYLIFSE